jgi:hypothetical protein
MKRHLIFSLTVLWLAFPSAALAIDGFPGSTWGEFHFESLHPGSDDVIADGWVRQGIGWKRWDEGKANLLLDTYVTTRYYWDTRGFDWYNYFGPGCGISLDLSAPNGPAISLGVEYIYQINYHSGTDRPYTALFSNWYHWWDIPEKNYPGSTWGDLRWEVPERGRSNFILEGWIRQGVVMKRWKKGSQTFVIDPYVVFRYKYDSLGLNWNNYVGPGGGIALDMGSSKGPLLSLGADYDWENDWKSGQDVSRIEIYLRWYAWWDLKKK